MKDRLESLVWSISGGLVILFIIYVFLAFLPYALYVKDTCLDNGYSSYDTTVTLEGYCITRKETTDIVVPLAELLDNQD